MGVDSGRARARLPVVRTFRLPQAPAPQAAAGPSLAWTVAVAAGVFAAVAVSWGRVLYADTYTALVAGRLIEHSGLPHTDALSVAAHGHRWIDQQWLAHLAYYESWRLGGYGMVGALSAALIAASFALLHRLMVIRGAAPVLAFGLVGLTFTVAVLNFETRSQSFAYPLFMLLVTLLCAAGTRDRFDRRQLLAWPLLLVWGNLHGSVLLGLAACGVFALVQIARAARRADAGTAARQAGWLAGAVASAAMTPYGLDGIGYYPSLLGNPNMRYIAEWQGARLGGASIPFIVMGLITVAACLRSRRQGARFDPFIACLTVAMGLMGIQAIRYQIWFALVAALLIADMRGQLAGARPPQGRLLPRLTVALCVAAAAGAVAVTAATPAGVFQQKMPPAALRATAAAAARVQGPILTDDLTGSALPWVSPQLAGRVAFDSRTEIYPPGRFEDFVRFLTVSPHWRRALSGYDEISVSCRLGHAKLCRAIPSLHGWRVVYRTPAAVVAVRTGRAG